MLILIALIVLTGAASAGRMAHGTVRADAAVTLTAADAADFCGHLPQPGAVDCPLCLVPAPPAPIALADAATWLLEWRAPPAPAPRIPPGRAPMRPAARAPPAGPRTA